MALISRHWSATVRACVSRVSTEEPVCHRVVPDWDWCSSLTWSGELHRCIFVMWPIAAKEIPQVLLSNLNFTHCTVRPINVPVINSPANRSPRPTDAGHQHLVSSWLNMTTLLNSVIPGRRPDYTDTVTLHAHIQPFSQIFMKSLSQRVVSKVKLMAQNNLIWKTKQTKNLNLWIWILNSRD